MPHIKLIIGYYLKDLFSGMNQDTLDITCRGFWHQISSPVGTTDGKAGICSKLHDFIMLENSFR